MKKSALPALLLAGLMLVSCDTGTAVLTGTSTPTGVSTAAPTTDPPAASEAVTTAEPVTTTAPVTYPTIYEKPEITGNHDNVVPVETINHFVNLDGYRLCFYHPIYDDSSGLSGSLTYTQIKEYFDQQEKAYNYEIALVTPLEIAPASENGSEGYNPGYHIRMAVDYVYETHLTRPLYNAFSDEMVVYYKMMTQNNDEWLYNENEITITTTGGKYVMLLLSVNTHYQVEAGTEITRSVIALPLTWELDMANVPGSTGDSWNRPPYIGRAEDYYAFGFGDVWERYMAD